MQIATQVVVLLMIWFTWIFAAGILWGGVAGFAGEGSRLSSFGIFGFALLLVFLCAAVVKYVFSLQARNWTLFFANLVAIFALLVDSLMREDILPPYFLY